MMVAEYIIPPVKSNAKAEPAKKAKSIKAGKIKLGLYSITYGGIWYKGGASTFADMAR